MESKKNNSAVNIRQFQKVCDILEIYNYNPNKLVTILQEVQYEYRYLPEDILTFVASSLDISPAKVYGVATFYSHFTLVPKGKYIIKVCDGTACHVKKSTAIIEALQTKLGLNNKKNTTDDLLITLEVVSCLGACGIAPIVVINDEVYSSMNPEATEKLIDSIISVENN
ncbi:MAG: NAD(P)H-dependent oxidoreductase subunit E [Bacteroidetes bacterium]|nr:NAD(P)H-dependent oxidoreductase subunit E [Bacteroidota bacterium]